MKKLYTFILIILLNLNGKGQHYQYEIILESIDIPELGGLQSYAVGTHDGEWLIIGGRLDGLHERQPFASFGSDGNNNQLIVVNPELGKVWKQDISTLPPSLREQLSSTNMQFLQHDGNLILTGGYSYSPSEGDHVTYPYLTVLKIESVIEKVKTSTVSAQDFSQIKDEFFRITGGRLGLIDDTFLLVGGHKFMGRYNPMGPNNGPGFVQEYSDAIRSFRIQYDPVLSFEMDTIMSHSTHLHRRDYNLVPQIINQQRLLMAFSGVFQKAENLPWLYPVSITRDSFEPLTSFSQLFNHYHCGTLPIYHEEFEEMHTLFFGGIAQFYEEDGVLVQDNDVPFVNTIADVVINAEGQIKEIRNGTVLPGYLGAGSEFILSHDIPIFEEGIVDGDLMEEEQVVGYLFGGIRSSMANIFFINTGQESVASETIYSVKLSKLTSSSEQVSDEKTPSIQIYPNPAQSFIRLLVELDQPAAVKIDIFDTSGQSIHTELFEENETQKGQNYLILKKVNIAYGAYIYHMKIGDEVITRKVIWSE